MFESSIYTAMILATCIGVPVSSGATDGKNCTKTITEQQTVVVPVIEYTQYRSCFLFFFCKYKKTSRTIYKTTLRPVYKDFPVCCPSFIEINSTCIKGCKVGKYGENCTNNCTCPKNAIDGCEKDTGNCTCVPGKQGEDCHEDCDVGHYGPQCIKTCSCLNNSTCSPVDGYCNCTAGYTGRNCEKKCNEGWYGLNCSYPCNCTSSQTCNRVSGDCTCKPGRQGQACEQECSNFTFGSNCAYLCDCVNETTQICNTSDGTCICKPGWEGTHCQYTCSSDTFGENCKSVCNCSSNYFCEPASGMCLSDCVCKQPGTSNCDDTRIPCNCSDEMKHGACNAATRTTVAQIRTFMTTVCSCKIEDSFCVPKNQSCFCRDGWTGNQCELEINLIAVKTDVSKTTSSDTATMIGGVVAAIGIVLTVCIVLVVILKKRKQSIKATETTKHEETQKHFTNAAYSTEPQNMTENIANTSTETYYSIARPLSITSDDTSGSQYVETAYYHHIKLNPGKDDKDVTSVYAHLAGNASSNGNDGSTYDVSSRGRSDFAYNADNAYGILRTTSESDDTYDATANKSGNFSMGEKMYDS